MHESPDAARIVLFGFERLQERFAEFTERAATHFGEGDARALRHDAARRIDLYNGIIGNSIDQLRRSLADRFEDAALWAEAKTAYAKAVSGRPDRELAETFFNSIARRVFGHAGVNRTVEFVAGEQKTPPPQPVYRVFECTGTVRDLFRSILGDYEFEATFLNPSGDAERLARAAIAHLRDQATVRHVDRIELADAVFYRSDGAYLVGQLYAGTLRTPIAIVLHNRNGNGISVDALLLTEDEVSIVFSFSRSYFLVATDRVYDLVRFLKALLPRKRVAELYIALGHNRHGKTELYRDLLRHLAQADEDELFSRAPGQRGLVMITFTMPSYDMVFKIIKDRFDPPKRVTHQQVLDRYRMVFRHDRAGRLVDAQPFEHLQFDKSRFAPDLLEELLQVAPKQVHVKGDVVNIDFVYMERRVTPLDIYVRERGEDATPAVVDYGRAIKDLARSGIFPGDLLLKNFGVTRHGRVVFYDYDEIERVTDINFRTKPTPRHEWQEMAAEPWYFVGEADVFPEEFESALGLSKPLRQVFKESHSDLFTAHFWCGVQERIQRGERIPVLPYPETRRLHRIDE